jgi:4-hydroxy-3-polyprenylbenzoate decarboxylase
MVLVIGITGASGAIYGIRLLELFYSMKDIETHLVISKTGELIIKYETGRKIEDIRKLANFWYDVEDSVEFVLSHS